MADQEDMSDADYLRYLAELLRYVPATYGTDDGDVSRLYVIAQSIEGKPAA